MISPKQMMTTMEMRMMIIEKRWSKLISLKSGTTPPMSVLSKREEFQCEECLTFAEVRASIVTNSVTFEQMVVTDPSSS